MNIDENWEDLKFFISLAKEKKLIKAAKVLGSNHTTVYRRITQFEEKFNLRLFERTPTGYFLTSAGEDLYKTVHGLEEQMDSVFTSIQGLENKIKGDVSLTTTPTIATTFLPKILEKLHRIYPEINIHLKVSNQFYNLSNREVDIAIRPANKVPLHLIGRNLGKVNFGLYGSKDFLKKNKIKNVFEDIDNITIIALDNSLEHLKSKQWLEKRLHDSSNVIRVDDIVVATKMCANNIGLALIPHYMAQEYKNLKLVFQPNKFIGSSLWVLTQKNLTHIPKVKTCTDFLCDEISKAIALE